MTVLKIVREECANFQPAGSYLGVKTGPAVAATAQEVSAQP